jgi:4-hydroxy-2-oxoheptanedioate aldolase
MAQSSVSRMRDILARLRDVHGCIGVKAEFEAEGTRIEEAIRLKDIISRVGVPLTIKIGGCEAVRDMYEAAALGAERIVAPMVESSYALSKFLDAAERILPDAEHHVMCETVLAITVIPEMLNAHGDRLSGVVVGRVDLLGSMGLSRAEIHSKNVTDLCEIARDHAHSKQLLATLGGGICTESLPLAHTFDRFETRKVVFATNGQGAEAISCALDFELAWLCYKRDLYMTMSQEDSRRIAMLEDRH